MRKFEEIILYIFSFIFVPIGIIFWIITLFKEDLQIKKIGRRTMYISFVSLMLFMMIGVVNFVVV
ncbi:hypothetical protein [Brevibacillus daliensis]|uniref:hypothetical protein n=1 Tax=Brevibacillus daliensis TaxID=2892995 RepID=UPI001E5744B2|nr:hypothetical protein [Brevibacillus daliensis]